VVEIVAVPAFFGWHAIPLGPRGVWTEVLLTLQVHIVVGYDSALTIRDERRSTTRMGRILQWKLLVRWHAGYQMTRSHCVYDLLSCRLQVQSVSLCDGVRLRRVLLSGVVYRRRIVGWNRRREYLIISTACAVRKIW